MDNVFKQNKDTYKISFVCDTTKLDNILQILEEYCQTISFFEHQGSEKEFLVEAFFEEEPDMNLINSLVPEAKLEKLEDKDWVYETQKNFKPIEAGDFFVHSSFYKKAAPQNKINIEINPGRAFGTGEHATTRGCLELISKLSNIESTYDLGTGSGILAIGAYKKFGGVVIGTDIDAQSIEVAKENAIDNDAKIKFDVWDGIKGDNKYDLVIANILAEPLIMMKNSITNASKNYIILSGFLNTQENQVLQNYQEVGAKLLNRVCIDNWVALLLKI